MLPRQVARQICDGKLDLAAVAVVAFDAIEHVGIFSVAALLVIVHVFIVVLCPLVLPLVLLFLLLLLLLL